MRRCGPPSARCVERPLARIHWHTRTSHLRWRAGSLSRVFPRRWTDGHAGLRGLLAGATDRVTARRCFVSMPNPRAGDTARSSANARRWSCRWRVIQSASRRGASRASGAESACCCSASEAPIPGLALVAVALAIPDFPLSRLVLRRLMPGARCARSCQQPSHLSAGRRVPLRCADGVGVMPSTSGIRCPSSPHTFGPVGHSRPRVWLAELEEGAASHGASRGPVNEPTAATDQTGETRQVARRAQHRGRTLFPMLAPRPASPFLRIKVGRAMGSMSCWKRSPRCGGAPELRTAIFFDVGLVVPLGPGATFSACRGVSYG